MSDAELTKRLERLERDNRRLKMFGASALVLVAALGLMAATRPVPDVIKAHEFEAVDGSGKVRVAMGIVPAKLSGLRTPGLALYDRTGRSVAELRTTDKFSGTFSDLMLRDPESKRVAEIYDSFGSPSFYLGKQHSPADSAISMGIMKGSPNIELRDAQGYMIKIGATETTTPQTGQTQKTSAASIIMFGNGKKHHVVWQAP